MVITWKGSPNFTAGRKYYWTVDNVLHGRIGKLAVVDKIIYHWEDGNMKSTDAVFSNPDRQVSAHFAVEDDQVHQYVKITDTAWHAGVGRINSESFGIEHSAQPGRYATDATYESSAQLVVMIARQWGKRVSDFQHLPHSAIVATQCPGTIDINRIVKRALEIEIGGGVDQPITSNAPTGTLASVVPTQVTITFPIQVSSQVGVNVRNEASTKSGIYAIYPQGSTIECDGMVIGESINGNNQWFRTHLHQKFVWSGAAKRI